MQLTYCCVQLMPAGAVALLSLGMLARYSYMIATMPTKQ
jgi:hypothetical protein